MYRRLERIAAYLAIVGISSILIIQEFFDQFLQDFTINAAIATMGISFVLVAWYLEGRLQSFDRSFALLSERIERLAEDQPRLIGAATSNFEVRSLSDAFKAATSRGLHVEHLRVYAISSIQIVHFVNHNKLKIDKCSVLVQSSHRHPDARQKEISENQALSAIHEWRSLVDVGRIRHLEILRYDFHPTEYECIFDDEYLILGLYDSKPAGGYSTIGVRDAVTIHAGSLAGARVISEFVERYDTLFLHCRDHYGPNDPETVFQRTN